ncbi:MAG: hypothetical protein EOO03_10240 [Chitinophagaceae bacterium]|nr:MAG: hypothetical protein EOO03_10240 [Chitinophagaceae bacterium]
MIEIIALFFLCRNMGKLALTKGERPLKWKGITILAWFAFELIGLVLAAMIFGTGNLVGLMLIGLMSAIGGYLIAKAQLEKLPDVYDDDIDTLGNHLN